jgi:hypothetical protein
MTRQVGKPRAWVLMGLAAGIVVSCAWTRKAAPQNAVNPNAAIVQEFESRVADYLKLHKTAEATLPSLKKPTESTEKIEHHQHKLRRAIAAQRAGAIQGNIFTPAISAEFRRLIAIAYHPDAKHIRESLQRGEPGTRLLRIRVNREYPDKAPLQTMPPSLLLNLPPLPPEVEYRVVGRTLILRDIDANLIVDVSTDVIPQ